MQEPAKPTRPPLNYSSPNGEYRKGATIAARIVAGFYALLFILGAFELWREDNFDVTSLATPSILLCFAGAFFCLMVLLGFIGRHKDPWI